MRRIQHFRKCPWLDCQTAASMECIFPTCKMTFKPRYLHQSSSPGAPLGRARIAMRFSRWSLFCSVLGVGCLTACDFRPSKGEKALLSQEAVATRNAPAEHVFQGQLGDKSMHLLIHNCEVFRVEPLAAGEVQWTSLVKPDPYPFWTACERQSMSFASGILTVDLRRRALGAGGCCATGGRWQTLDGLHWKKL